MLKNKLFTQIIHVYFHQKIFSGLPILSTQIRCAQNCYTTVQIDPKYLLVVEEMVVEGPIVEGTLIERFANKKTLVEGLVTKNFVKKKMEVDSILFKSLVVEDL